MQAKKIKLVITGEDVDGKIYKRTVEGNTEMAPEDVRESLKMLSGKGLLKTFCAVIEVCQLPPLSAEALEEGACKSEKHRS